MISKFQCAGNASHASQVGRTTQPMVDNLIPHVVVSNAQEQSRHIQEITMQGQPTSLNRHNKEASASTYRYNAQCSISGTTRAMADERVDPSFVGNNVHEQMQRVQGITMQDHISASSESKRELSVTTPSGYDSRLAPHGVGNTGTRSGEATRSSNVDDGINNIGHPISLCGENEKPFTYIFNMLADWGVQQDTVPYIQGKIKVCLLLSTLVAHFQMVLFTKNFLGVIQLHQFHISSLTKLVFNGSRMLEHSLAHIIFLIIYGNE